MNTTDRARNRWREILPLLGIDPKFLVNKHGPCPLCGGVDRFRWDDKDGHGTYYCGQCGPGPGIMLVRKKHGWNHKTACDEIDKIIGAGVPDPQPAKRASIVNNRAALDRIVAGATDPNIVRVYLKERGLKVVPGILMGHPSLPYHPQGNYPAMVAPVTGPDGSLQSLHRTYMADVPDRKKLMPCVDSIKGGAVRLFEVKDRMGIAEGIETAIAAAELFQIRTWAAISAGNMEAFVPPADIRHLTIFADHDRNFVGQKAAHVLAHRLAGSIDIDVKIPPAPGDWLDVLNERVP